MNKSQFESRVVMLPFCGCWIWEGATGAGKKNSRYGQFSKDGKTVYAHRYSHELYKRPLLKGEHVLHSCDVSECVNPEHLSAGSNLDNIRDSMAKGRRKGVSRNRPSGLIYRKRGEQ